MVLSDDRVDDAGLGGRRTGVRRMGVRYSPTTLKVNDHRGTFHETTPFWRHCENT